MAIVYRVTNAPNTGSSFTKNTTLTYAEGDGNLAVLENLSSSFLAFSSSYNTGSFTGSFTGNGSGLTGIISASYAATASSANDFLVRGTITAQTLIVQTITSSVEFVTGSTHFGSLIGNTHQFTGSVSVSGSITVANGVINNLTASNAISSSYAVTASYSNNSTSASYAATASFATSGSMSVSASYALTSSYSNNSTSASYAATASYANNFSASGNLVVGGTITSGGTPVVLGSGTTNTIPKFTSTSTLGNSLMVDNGSTILVNGATDTGFGAMAINFRTGGGNANLILNTNGTSTGIVFTNTAASNKLWGLSTPVGSIGDFSIDESNFSPPRMYFQAGGNVGINTANPLATLHVSGTVRFPNLTTSSSLSNIVMTNPATGQLYYTASSVFVTNVSDTYTGTAAITDIITLTAAEYSGIGSPLSSTLYVII